MRFNRQTLEALIVPEGKAFILAWDDALRGFGIKVNAGGARQWVAQYRTPDGRTPRVTIGRVDTLSLDEARKAARIILGKAQTGSDPQAEKVAAKAAAAVTLESVIRLYLSHAESRLRPRSFQETERHLLKGWAPLHARPINAIRRAEVAAQLGVIAQTGRVNGSRARAALSALFSWAIGEAIAEANPVIGTHRPAGNEASRDRVLTEAEVKAVWLACRDDDHGLMVRLLLLTGQRREEVGGLEESELDLAAGIWTLPATRTKNRRPHEVPLSPLALEILARKPRVQGRALVFGLGEGGFSGWSNSKERLDKRIAAVGFEMPAWRLHDLRRTMATMMAESLAVPPHIIEAIINHVSGARSGVAGIYNRASYRTEKRDALNRWALHLAALVQPSSVTIDLSREAGASH
ncbi:site-specific integrase [Methylobacterium sp. WL69]|uniref:tyrosine-type recombinase/integrase n=1 Tax=Methylobacterium sp. WL69 TaxID=2603893 RepID=UPI0011C8CF08|nr:site-specific integrase [Methylobacterium sp. WL69]TXM72923.1 site-specific integrase [Methylobacterium sp. WL69]